VDDLSDQYKIRDAGSTGMRVASGCEASGAQAQTCAKGSIDYFVLQLGDGTDRARINSGAMPGTIDGGSGDDDINGGFKADLLLGGTGDDRLFGDAGADKMYGGAGNDQIFGNAVNDGDFIDAGPGDDYINTRDYWKDEIVCGDGHDRVSRDSDDTVAADCEVVM
jgi:Ca2+-binding RTX toxin-like protein